MITTLKQEKQTKGVLEMMNEALQDRRVHSILAKKAQIFSPDSHQSEGCLWLTGGGVYTAYRQMFVYISPLEGRVKVSVTITDDDVGLTNYLVWGYGNDEDKASVTKMLIFLVEDIVSGNGMPVDMN